MTILDPLAASDKIATRYRHYLESTFRPQDETLRTDFESALRHDIQLTKGPLLEASAPFETGRSVADLVAEGVLNERFLSLGEAAFDVRRPLYRHQEEAIRKAVNGRRNLVVSTGTGSGKTEAFLLPIVNSLLNEADAGTLTKPGVRALLLYPMNALANDQVKRLRSFLRDLPEITFGRYVGETQASDKEAKADFRDRNRGEPPSNELLSRDQMQGTPPHLLLTNYAMLEYLLLRPDDSPLFDANPASWQFIVLDEAHVYGGAQGTEVAMLLRRLKDRVTGSEPGRLHCFATSATLGGGPEDHPQLTDFATDLFGETFTCEGPHHDVVVATRRPLAPEDATRSLDADAFRALQAAVRGSDDALDPWSTDTRAEALQKLAATHNLPEPGGPDSWPRWLYEVLRSEEHVVRLHKQLDAGAVDLGTAAEVIFGQRRDQDAVVSLVDLCVLAKPQADDVPLIPARYHFFLRSLENGFVCRHPRHPAGRPRLRLARHKHCPDCFQAGTTSTMFELGICRSCGVDYLVGQRGDNQRSDNTTSGQAFEPSASPFGTPDYLLCQPPTDDHDDLVAGHSAATVGTVPRKLCLTCSTLRDDGDRCPCSPDSAVEEVHHVQIPDGEQLHVCPACRSRTSGEAVTRLVTGTDAPAAVIATDLYQAIPPSTDRRLARRTGQGRKLLSFADSRQDAAFFAAYLDRTYTRAVQRRVLYKAITDLAAQDVPRAEDVLGATRRQAENDLLLDPDASSITKNGEVGAWLIQELMALDRRQSLEGTGLVSLQVAVPRHWEPPRALLQLGFSEDEVVTLLQLLLETVRASGALVPPGNVDLRDARFEPRNRPIYLREQGSETGVLSWSPARDSVSNRRIEILQAVFAARGINADPQEVLQGIWRHLTDPDEGWQGALVAEQDKRFGAVWRLNWERFEIQPLAADHPPRRCRRCRRLWHHTLDGLCPAWRCDGRVEPADPTALRDDHYARLATDIDSIAMEAHEHTAQWTAAQASKLQERFVRGEVNTLSCSTTFELGVDVGDVQAVLLRNVPPSPANYVQRAGRAGRRADSAALVVTFAQRRSHDLTYFESPHHMVGGRIAPPHIQLDNPTIARRHVHSVAFADFERSCAQQGERHQDVESFFPLASADNSAVNPPAMDEDPNLDSASLDAPDDAPDSKFARWLRSRPLRLQDTLRRTFPEPIVQHLGVHTWAWVETLLERSPDDPASGALERAGLQARDNLASLDRLFETARTEGKGSLMESYRRVRRTFANEYLLSYLAKQGVLPKYGFPVDVVDLNVAFSGDQDARRLDMSRDLQMAIVEYAPGSKVVAAKALWEGQGLATRPGRNWPTYHWAQCGECDAYREALHDLGPCPVCGSGRAKPGMVGQFVIPVFGFVGHRAEQPGESRPRRATTRDMFFSSYQDDPGDVIPCLDLSGPTPVSYRVSREGRVNVVNRGPAGRGYQLCEWCGHGQPAPANRSSGRKKKGDQESHKNARRPGHPCKGTLRQRHLGHRFLTDVVEVRLGRSVRPIEALSTLHALIEGVSAIGIDPDDVNGTLHTYSQDSSPALIIFDAVAGGAGHAQRIGEQLNEVVRAALRRVEDCTCGVETSCYTCLRSYRNQAHHENLVRGAAADILRSTLRNPVL